jgi:hypothetical protein
MDDHILTNNTTTYPVMSSEQAIARAVLANLITILHPEEVTKNDPSRTSIGDSGFDSDDSKSDIDSDDSEPDINSDDSVSNIVSDTENNVFESEFQPFEPFEPFASYIPWVSNGQNSQSIPVFVSVLVLIWGQRRSCRFQVLQNDHLNQFMRGIEVCDPAFRVRPVRPVSHTQLTLRFFPLFNNDSSRVFLSGIIDGWEYWIEINHLNQIKCVPFPNAYIN